MISPVSAGGGFTRTGIGTIVDMISLEIEVDVNETYINRVHSDQQVEATLDAYPDWKIPAHVITTCRRRIARRRRCGAHRLRPARSADPAGHGRQGRSSRARKRRPRRADTAPRMIVPKAAIRTADGRRWCSWSTRTASSAAPSRSATTNGDQVEVLAGVTAGERVVARARPATMKDGDKIKVQ